MPHLSSYLRGTPSVAKNKPGLAFRPIDVFTHAARFEYAALILDRAAHPIPVQSNNWVGAAYFTSITNAAFAVELYLKSLVHLETSTYPEKAGHRTDTLFQMLTALRRARFESIYEEKFGLIQGFVSLRQRGKNDPKLQRELQIEGALEICASVFEKSRYSFEGWASGPFGGRLLAATCRTAILEVEPAWISQIEPSLLGSTLH